MAMAVHERPDMAELWQVRERNPSDSSHSSAPTNTSVLFRENKKWRQHATQASKVDDGGRRVRVVLTGARARVRWRPPPPPPLVSPAFPSQQYKQVRVAAEGTPVAVAEGAAAVEPRIVAIPTAGKTLRQPSEPPGYLVVENLEEELWRLLDQISKSGEPVYRVQAGLAMGSEHIECCDELTQWAFRLLKNGPGNDEWRMKIERMVYKVLFEYIRKTHSGGNSDSRSGAGCSTDAEELEVVGTRSSKPEGTLVEMLSWLKEAAKNPQELNVSSDSRQGPMQGLNLNEPPPRDDNLPQLKRMAISAREALFTNVKELSAAEDFPYRNSKKQKTQHHVGDIPRAAAGDLSLIERGESAEGSSSVNRILRQPQRRSPRSLCLLKFSTFERKRVPVGPAFQADIPQWKGRSSKKWDNSDELRRLGTLILPPLLDLPQTKREEEEEEEEAVGRGRPEMCGCSSPRSVLCVRSHVAQSRIELRWSLGKAFGALGFDGMGEEVSGSWTLAEQQIFEALVRLNPPSDEKSFLEPALKLFGSKTRRDIVSFYFNAFVFRRMGIQTRLIGCDADSDDDEFDVELFEDLYPRAAYRV